MALTWRGASQPLLRGREENIVTSSVRLKWRETRVVTRDEHREAAVNAVKESCAPRCAVVSVEEERKTRAGVGAGLKGEVAKAGAEEVEGAGWAPGLQLDYVAAGAGAGAGVAGAGAGVSGWAGAVLCQGQRTCLSS